MMLIVAVIGVFTPTLFYEIYGSVSFPLKVLDRSRVTNFALHFVNPVPTHLQRLRCHGWSQLVQNLLLRTHRSRRRSFLPLDCSVSFLFLRITPCTRKNSFSQLARDASIDSITLSCSPTPSVSGSPFELTPRKSGRTPLLPFTNKVSVVLQEHLNLPSSTADRSINESFLVSYSNQTSDEFRDLIQRQALLLFKLLSSPHHPQETEED